MIRLFVIILGISLINGCSYVVPKQAHKDACALYAFDDDWKEAAEDSAQKWGTPPHILLAFVKQESGFQKDVRPPRDYFLGVVPLPRRSSAYGYSQAQDPVWNEYIDENNRVLASRENIHDALDFIGWYNYKSYKRNGISRTDAYNLYLAYHEGNGGFARKTYLKKPWLINVANKVVRYSNEYKSQLNRCGSRKYKQSTVKSWSEPKNAVHSPPIKQNQKNQRNAPCNAPWPYC